MRIVECCFLFIFALLFSCSDEIVQEEPEEELPKCDFNVSLAANSVSEHVYFCDSANRQSLFIYTPQNWHEEAELPCIVYFHGAIDDASQYKKQSEHFRRRGLVAVSVNHRFTIPKSYTKNGFRDGHAAIRWVKENHLLLGIDTMRIAISGSSSGGAVALSCYLNLDLNHPKDDLSISTKPNLMVVSNPQLVDLLTIPIDVSDHPATLFFQGDDDDITPLRKLEAYIDTVSLRGAKEIKLVIYPGRGHGFFNYDVSVPDFENTLFRSDSFLVEHGFLLNYIDK